MRWRLLPLLALCPAAACSDTIDLDPLDSSPVVEAAVRPPPISGGTLAIADDGTVVAADPDRDLVYVVGLADRTLRHTIALEPGDEPGRVVAGSEGLAHVSLRGASSIATIDLSLGTVVSRRSVCSDPRGLAFEAELATLHVACADGRLVHLPEDEALPATVDTLEPDLRDVVALGGVVWASRFRAAELVTAGDERTGPLDGDEEAGPGADPRFVPHVAWRTFVGPAGGSAPQILMLHQVADTLPVPTDGGPVRDDGGGLDGGGFDGGGLGGGGLPYGGGGGCEPGISGTAVSIVDGPDSETVMFPGLPLAVDAALSPDGEWIAMAVPGATDGVSSLQVMPFTHLCELPLATDRGEGQVTAVAFAADGTMVTQSREPAQLVIRAGEPLGGKQEIVALSAESRFDTGHEIFHRATESGLSCATCHPEGGDDGHVWVFDPMGARRTQPLDVGLEGTAPFHWDGDMRDLDTIMDEVMSHRMGGDRQSPERLQSFASWLFQQEQPPAAGEVDPALVEEGAAAFGTFKCGTCHAGANFMSNDTVTVRGQELQVPSLRRISLRPPYMHDGRSATLEYAIIDMLEATAPDLAYEPADVVAIAAYLRTL